VFKPEQDDKLKPDQVLKTDGCLRIRKSSSSRICGYGPDIWTGIEKSRIETFIVSMEAATRKHRSDVIAIFLPYTRVKLSRKLLRQAKERSGY